MLRILVIIFLIIPFRLLSQVDSVPVNKTLKDKPVPNYPDSNSIYMPPDTNAIYKEEQGYPDKEKKIEINEKKYEKDSIKIKKTEIKKDSKKTVPASRDKTKVVTKKIKKKPTTDTTGTGTKQDF